ncbi:hypothetical protein AVEN_82020-1 [Araneus ventricosus]|uniref:Uncharacterized protein n=1 Tax=Araneus ventricosus TaxID=182803 RepID=A0A4Y2IAP2_ARAVE|nr:hypothetical protein AVEN_82020-1 [Araneus ventricosus]
MVKKSSLFSFLCEVLKHFLRKNHSKWRVMMSACIMHLYDNVETHVAALEDLISSIGWQVFSHPLIETSLCSLHFFLYEAFLSNMGLDAEEAKTTAAIIAGGRILLFSL